MLLLYAMERLQYYLPLNPQQFGVGTEITPSAVELQVSHLAQARPHF